MAKKTYVGVNNIARNVSKMYVGVNGVARRVKKAYVGVNGVARQCYPNVKIVTWNGGTDEEIKAMVQAADEGLINLTDYWSVGDTRTVSLSAMAAEYVGESHAAQTVEFVLMNASGKTLANATSSGRTTCSFIVGMKNGLNEGGTIYNAPTNNQNSWVNSPRRTWCNNTFRNAIPSSIRDIFKQFVNYTSIGQQSSTIVTSTDYFIFPSEMEVFNTHNYSFEGEGTQISYYQTQSQRIKKIDGTPSRWWERSPRYNKSNQTCVAASNGGNDGAVENWNNLCGVSPYGVI